MTDNTVMASERLDVATQTLSYIRTLDSGHVWGALAAMNALSSLFQPSTFEPSERQRRQIELIGVTLMGFEQHLTAALFPHVAADEIRQALVAVSTMLQSPDAIDGSLQARAAILQGGLTVLLNREALSGVVLHMPEAALAHFMKPMDQPNGGRRPSAIPLQ